MAEESNQTLKASIMECLSASNRFQDLRQLAKIQEALAKQSDGMQTNIEA